MRKLATLTTVILFSCIMISSCSDDGYKTGISLERDKTLAGSISYGTYEIDVEGTFNGTPIENFNRYGNHFLPHKLSDTEVSVVYTCVWGDNNLYLSISSIPVLGKPFDVTLDYISFDATVKYNDTEYSSVRATIKGWITESKLKNLTRTSPYMPVYQHEIRIDCTLDGEVLTFIITPQKR